MPQTKINSCHDCLGRLIGMRREEFKGVQIDVEHPYQTPYKRLYNSVLDSGFFNNIA